MSVLTRFRPALLLAAIAAVSPAALGADTAATPASSEAYSGMSDRLFLAFAQDAVLVKSQWWEGQVEKADGSRGVPVDVLLVRGVVAFRPIKSLEVGGRVGFGKSSASLGRPDGTGATDLDVYGKWVWPDAASRTDFAAGVVVTVPTGDDTAGLGYNSFSAQAFGGVRYRFDEFVIGGHLGIRYNGKGKFQGDPPLGSDLSGKTSYELGVSALFPLANRVSLVGEAVLETARFGNRNPDNRAGSKAASQVLVGVNWKAFARGTFRAAVDGGLTSGAPNFRVLLGYAYSY